MRCIARFVPLLMTVLLSWFLTDARAGDRVWRIDDFEDGDLRAGPGLPWFPLADDAIGGASTAKVVASAPGAGGSRGALRLAGRSTGKKGTIVSAWVMLEGTGRAVDLTSYEGIRLQVKGPGRLLVGLRGGSMNYMTEVGTDAGWQRVDVPFARLEPVYKVPNGTAFSPAAVTNLGISTPMHLDDAAGGPTSDVVFEIDDVEIYGRPGAEIPPAATGPAGSSAVLPFTPLSSIPTDGWVELATDPVGDANRPLLPDATRVEVHQRGTDGWIWFRMTLREAPHDRWMGVNVALDLDGDPNNGRPWWGRNKEFRFDRLLTVWCWKVADECLGAFVVADADAAVAGALSGGSTPPRFAIDRERRAFVVGVPRADLRLGTAPPRLVAAVGTALVWGDDVPDQGAVVLR